MPPQSHTRRASVSGALFALCILLAPRITPAHVEGQPLREVCPPAHLDERVEVSYVYDGDTVRLSDGRRVRFIGINTPEMAHHDTRTEPYAEIARTSLQNALENSGNLLSLQYGRERRDHYGRLLAHAYLSNGENIAVLLLSRGHATTLVVPPNTATADCYQQVEQEARAARRGLWQLADYQTRAAESLPGTASGFYIVRGKVTDIHRTRQQVHIALEGLLVARISVRDLANFEPDYLERLVGHTVELRGWIRPEKNGLHIRVHHPAALALAGAPPGK